MTDLTRFWIVFESPTAQPADGSVRIDSYQPTGFGVTAVDLDDALTMVAREFFKPRGRDLPPIEQLIENIDVSTLDMHVTPNMHPPNWRGIWYPRLTSLR